MISVIVYQQVAISDARLQATADSDANSNFNSRFFERSDSDSSFSQMVVFTDLPSWNLSIHPINGMDPRRTLLIVVMNRIIQPEIFCENLQITEPIPIPPHFDNLDSDSNFSKKWEWFQNQNRALLVTTIEGMVFPIIIYFDLKKHVRSWLLTVPSWPGTKGSSNLLRSGVCILWKTGKNGGHFQLITAHDPFQ